MPAVLITGGNRGMGLEWVRQYAEQGWRVYATCRHPDQAGDLHALADRFPQVTIQRLDVTRPQEINRVSIELRDTPLDVLINNAGVYFERWGRDKLGTIDYDDWEETLRVNVLGAMRVTEAMVGSLERSPTPLVVAISSHMGSITDIETPNDYAYRSSKAALNAAMKGLSCELVGRGIGLLLLHPGWVRTRMGGENAPLSPEESVQGMHSIMARYEPSISGRFFRYDGKEMPW